MSNNRIVFEGLAELRDALRRLPAELKAEATSIVQDAATGAASEITAAYPERTGNLRRGVSVRPSEVSTFGTGAVVINRSPHAWMFENGTQARHTAIGANRGAMPPGHVFIPVVMRRRRRMYEQLIELLKQQGLQVTGSAG